MTDREQVNQYEDEQRNSPTTSNTRDQPTYAVGYTQIPPNSSRHSELQRRKTGSFFKTWSRLTELFLWQQAIPSQHHPGVNARITENPEDRKRMQACLRRKRSKGESNKQRRNLIMHYLKAEILEEKLKQEEEDRKRQIDTDHRRVNLAFLNRLQISASDRVSEPMSNTLCEDNDELEDPASSPVTNPLQGHTEEEGCEQVGAVTKLLQNFPYYEQDMLEDILRQCNGDYKQAYELLNV
ncbi:hypothetical protein E1301_Tti016153 [Triplophysa tibetana]|uniref:Uncharacterized protein n=1 Tax=Triplophysa tibetana TaxID=1572043 RepID=A0A5A9P451_9TELE|nr:hypothetical protein E1301_Tti016153 [Triplophysa tibetana]